MTSKMNATEGGLSVASGDGNDAPAVIGAAVGVYCAFLIVLAVLDILQRRRNKKNESIAKPVQNGAAARAAPTQDFQAQEFSNYAPMAIQFHLAIIQQHAEQGRQHETLRSSASSMLVQADAVVVALLGYANASGRIIIGGNYVFYIAAIFLIVTGLIGLLLVLAHTDIAVEHRMGQKARKAQIKALLDEFAQGAKYRTFHAAVQDPPSSYTLANRCINTHVAWGLIHIFIVGLGMALAVMVAVCNGQNC
jgi:hypothetical protein